MISITELCEMDLHDCLDVGSFCSVLRVPGGWIYRFYGKDDRLEAATFVPDPTRDTVH